MKPLRQRRLLFVASQSFVTLALYVSFRPFIPFHSKASYSHVFIKDTLIFVDLIDLDFVNSSSLTMFSFLTLTSPASSLYPISKTFPFSICPFSLSLYVIFPHSSYLLSSRLACACWVKRKDWISRNVMSSWFGNQAFLRQKRSHTWDHACFPSTKFWMAYPRRKIVNSCETIMPSTFV